MKYLTILLLCFLLSIKQMAYSQSSEVIALKEKLRAIFSDPVASKKQYPSLGFDNIILTNRIHYRYGILCQYSGSAQKKLVKHLNKELDVEFVVAEELKAFAGHTIYVLVPKLLLTDYEKYKADIQVERKQADSLYTVHQQKKAPTRFVPEPQLISEASKKYNIDALAFTDFDNYLKFRESLQKPVEDQNLGTINNFTIEPVRRESKKGFPYYGKTSIKLMDSQEREVGTYGYTFDQKADPKPYDPLNVKEFKASVTTSSRTNHYDIYCDGQKVTSHVYVQKSDQTHYEGGGVAGALFMGLLKGLWDVGTESLYEAELFTVAQQRVCYYHENAAMKNEKTGKELFERSQLAIKQGKWGQAVELLDGAVWATQNPQYIEARADIFKIFNQVPEAFKDYLYLINRLKSQKKTSELAVAYRKMAVVLSVLKNPIYYQELGFKDTIILPEYAVTYLGKASVLGDIQAKEVLSKGKNNNEIINSLQKLY